MKYMEAEILALLNVPTDLTLRFFALFSRFEYALKCAGYATGDDTRVSANWDGFASDLRGFGDAALKPIFDSCLYLQGNPPKKQILLPDGRLEWQLRSRGTLSPIENLLLDIRTVRNNVFHGGKFPSGPVAEPLRDQQLIEDCLAVLASLLQLNLPKGVAEHFRP